MRHHSYIDRPRRLPPPRAGRLRRTRFAPVLFALPLVTLMWLTIGLPIFAELSSTGSGNGRARDVSFSTGVNGNGSGGGNGGRSGDGVPQTVAAATVSPRIVREVRLIRERLLVSASGGNGSSRHSGGKSGGRGAVLISAPVHPSATVPNTTPLSTSGDGSSLLRRPRRFRPSSSPPPPATPPPSSSASSAPPPPPPPLLRLWWCHFHLRHRHLRLRLLLRLLLLLLDLLRLRLRLRHPRHPPPPPPRHRRPWTASRHPLLHLRLRLLRRHRPWTSSRLRPATSASASAGAAAPWTAGATSPPPPPPPPPATMPAAADVQTQNGGSKAGKPESGDSITFTFAGASQPGARPRGLERRRNARDRPFPGQREERCPDRPKRLDRRDALPARIRQPCTVTTPIRRISVSRS